MNPRRWMRFNPIPTPSFARVDEIRNVRNGDRIVRDAIRNVRSDKNSPDAMDRCVHCQTNSTLQLLPGLLLVAPVLLGTTP